MRTVYPVLEKKGVRLIIVSAILITISLIVISILVNQRLFLLINMLLPIFIVIQRIRMSYIIDEEEGTFSIMNGKKVWRKVNLQEFSRMDIHRKKNGKIKKIVLRNSTNLFYQVEPHNRDLFISHIMRLVPGINSIERKATWHS